MSSEPNEALALALEANVFYWEDESYFMHDYPGGWPQLAAAILAALADMTAARDDALTAYQESQEMLAQAEHTTEMVAAKRGAARALADELGRVLLEHKVSGCEWYDEWPAETDAALAKWEASRG